MSRHVTGLWRSCAVVLLICVSGPASAQVIAEVAAGVGGPVGEEQRWYPGLNVDARAGVGINLGDAVLGLPLLVRYAEVHGPTGRFQHVDSGLDVHYMWKVAPLLVGVHLAPLLRVIIPPVPVPDPFGAPVKAIPELGMDVGGVIWWPLRRWLALSVRLDYRLTVPISEVEAGFPRHGLGWSMGFVFTL